MRNSSAHSTRFNFARFFFDILISYYTIYFVLRYFYLSVPNNNHKNNLTKKSRKENSRDS